MECYYNFFKRNVLLKDPRVNYALDKNTVLSVVSIERTFKSCKSVP